MFVVNCGEIVWCVICMLWVFGICSVVVYSDVDVVVFYVCEVDVVVWIGLVFVVEFYFDIDVVIVVVCCIGV